MSEHIITDESDMRIEGGRQKVGLVPAPDLVVRDRLDSVEQNVRELQSKMKKIEDLLNQIVKKGNTK